MYIVTTILSYQQMTSKVPITIDWYSSPASLSSLDTTNYTENPQTLTNKHDQENPMDDEIQQNRLSN